MLKSAQPTFPHHLLFPPAFYILVIIIIPATHVAIALHSSKQSPKAPLLLPFSTPSPFSRRDLVIKTALSKLRLKKASRVFVADGRELLKQQDWEDVLKDDVVFLVSAGEEYVGTKKK